MFVAAGLNNLSSRVNRKRNPVRAGKNRIVWFSLNISIALCSITGSVFFVNWSEINWSINYIYFSLVFFGIFYFGFLFKYVIGVPLFFVFTCIVLFLNIYLQEWIEIPPGGELGNYRILSHDQNYVKAELTVFGGSPVFLQGESSQVTLGFEVLQFDEMMFFLNSDSYFRMTDPVSKTGFSDLIINTLAENLFLLTENIYTVDIEAKALLYQYTLILDKDQKKIIIEN